MVADIVILCMAGFALLMFLFFLVRAIISEIQDPYGD